MMSEEHRAISDIGGLSAGPIDTHEHEPTMTERRVDALMMVLRADPHSLWTTDENRRMIESLVPEFYEGSAYYERWIRAMTGLLLEKGVVTQAEIDAKMADVRARFEQSEA